jgi:para-nitrobenzyl esterase
MRTLAVLAIAACAHPPSPQPAATAAPAAAAPELVQIDTGMLHGTQLHDTLAWRGVPYAAPPVGPLRWRPPQPPAAWSGVREASGFGYACMQSGTSQAPKDTPMGSEDCLTLNVWRPSGGSAARPVMVFIHGGYFAWGSSNFRKEGVDLYDGAELAARGDVVVVTLNYRLGPFGFLAHPALAEEDPHHSTGDYGLLDQIAALQWVQRNIAAFGGDPRRVTVFGQSAGAISTAALYASPLARGLFAGAIVHSGNGNAKSLQAAARGGITLAKQVGCDRATTQDTVQCMRAQTPSAIAAAVPEQYAPGGLQYAPVVDGWVLPRRPIDLVAHGEQNQVPLIVATTSNEFSTMVAHYLASPAPCSPHIRPPTSRARSPHTPPS